MYFVWQRPFAVQRPSVMSKSVLRKKNLKPFEVETHQSVFFFQFLKVNDL